MNDEVMEKVELKRVLGFWDLVGLTLGQIIGAGILTYTGVGISMTGRSVVISYILSAFLVLFTLIPILIVNSVFSFSGGQYSQVTKLVSKRAGGIFIIIFIASNMAISLYALSFGEYFVSFFGFGNERVVAFLILTFFYGINLIGIENVSKVQKFIVISLLIAFFIFIFRGFGKVSDDFFTKDFITHGYLGVFQAAALLNFAIVGAQNIVNLSGECINPKKDLPRVGIICTILVGFLYAVISYVAAGVFDVEVVMNKPLDIVAEEILSRPEYVYFSLGGALLALVGPLNGQFAWATKPLIEAAKDGWFNKNLATLHPKTRTPYKLLTIFYIIGIVPILLGLDIRELAVSVVSVSQSNNLLLIYSLIGLKKNYDDDFKKSKFYMSKNALYVLTIISTVFTSLQVIVLLMDLKKSLIILNIGILIFAITFSKFKNLD